MTLEEKILDSLIESEYKTINVLDWENSRLNIFLEDIEDLEKFLILYIGLEENKHIEIDNINIIISDYQSLKGKLNELDEMRLDNLITNKIYQEINNNLTKNSLPLKEFIKYVIYLSLIVNLFSTIPDILQNMQDIVDDGYKAFSLKDNPNEPIEIYYIAEDERLLSKVVLDNFMGLFLLVYSDIYRDVLNREKNLNILKARIKKYQSRLKVNLATATSWSFNQGIKQAMIDNDVKEYRYTAILDNRTSEICKGLHGMIFKVKDIEVGVNYPPMHRYCRSSIVPI